MQSYDRNNRQRPTPIAGVVLPEAADANQTICRRQISRHHSVVLLSWTIRMARLKLSCAPFSFVSCQLTIHLVRLYASQNSIASPKIYDYPETNRNQTLLRRFFLSYSHAPRRIWRLGCHALPEQLMDLSKTIANASALPVYLLSLFSLQITFR